MTNDGLMEHEINKIIDSQQWGCGYCYLVHWVGYGPEDDEWLPAHTLENCEALDKWMENGGDGLIGPASAKQLFPGFTIFPWVFNALVGSML